MKHQWINRKGNPVLLMFFNGWGMDANVFSHLSVDDVDVLMFYDYTDTSLPELADCAKYAEIHLAAWSLGVYAAAFSGLKLPIWSATAFNGTILPISAVEGIDPIAFEATLANWNEIGQKKFYRRIRGGSEFSEPQRTLTNQRTELAKIAERAVQTTKPNLHFTRAFAGANDRIFLLAAQRACWEKRHVPLTVLPEPHYLFGHYKFWKELYLNEN